LKTVLFRLSKPIGTVVRHDARQFLSWRVASTNRSGAAWVWAARLTFGIRRRRAAP